MSKGALEFYSPDLKLWECRRWEVDEVARISKTCIILHEMLIHMINIGNIEHVDGEEIVTNFFEERLQTGEGADAAMNTI